MRNGRRKIPALVLSVILFFTCGTLSGCFDLFKVAVKSVTFESNGADPSVLDLTLGQTEELNTYVTVSPSRAKNKAFSVQSSDTGVVDISVTPGAGKVDRVYAVAKSVGNATLTVVTDDGNKKASLSVRVSYAQPSGITIVPDETLTSARGTVIMIEDGIVPVQLTASLGENVDPATVVLWQTDGRETELPYTRPFSVTPDGIGQTVVTAAVAGNGLLYEDSIKINVYSRATGASVQVTGGSTEQRAEQLETVSLRLVYDELPQGNPDAIVVWYVNGKQTAMGDNFDYLPAGAGKYEIEGVLNGQRMEGCTVTVKVRGVIVPQNVWLDYDNCYPEVWVRWDTIAVNAGYRVLLKDASTGLSFGGDLSTDNLAVRGKFTPSGFDATAVLAAAGKSIFETRFTVQVQTLADEVLEESPYSTAYTSDKVPAQAKSYLEKKFYDGARNYYVKSYEEFYEWFEYAMLWRPSSVSGSGEKLYLDYAFDKGETVIERAMKEMHFTGNYQYSGTNKGKECTFRILFNTDGTPSKRTSGHTGGAWNALRPHVNGDASKVRPADHAFAIDSKTPVSVRTSDQLYYMAQLGYRPVPVAGSAADTLYAYARNVMRYIVSDDMTDVQKVHAVYDWIMWRVTYDNAVLNVTDTKEAVKYESYYLESVLTDTDPYGVCDAMSKAFVLLTNIEGIESIRVTGEAVSGTERVGHAWNKVKIDGQWYVADCTWGDYSSQIQVGGAYRETASHLYFLLSDSDVKTTHIEDPNGNFPRTAAQRYPWYEEQTVYHDGKTSDFYLAYSALGVQSELNALANYMADTAQAASRSFYVRPCPVNSISAYYAFEIVADSRYTKNTLTTALDAAMRASGYRNGSSYWVSIQNSGSYRHMIVFLAIPAH